MRVGYVLKKFPRLSETFILNELLALEAQGVEVEVFSLKDPDDEPRHPALGALRARRTTIRPLAPRSIFRHLEELWKKSDAASREALAYYVSRLQGDDPRTVEALGYAVALSPLIRERGIDRLHAHFATIAAAAAAEVSCRTGVPFSFTMHAKDIYRRGVRFDTLGRWMRDAAFCVTVCEANRRWIEEHVEAGALAGLRVLYNGLDLERWPVKTEFPSVPVFGAVGRLVEKKGFDRFLRACALLRLEGREFRAWLAGSGEDEAALRALHAELDLAGVVEMPGPLTQDEVRERLARTTLLVAPCRVGTDGNRDALPTVILEAMAAGTPCLATPVGGIPEMFDDPDEGWLVEPGTPENLARVMSETIDAPKRAIERGRAARRRVERLFDIRANSARLAAWFRESASGEAPARRSFGESRSEQSLEAAS